MNSIVYNIHHRFEFWLDEDFLDEQNIEANVRDEISSGKIHDYVGLSEFIQRDDTTQSRFIINVHEGDTFVTHVRVLIVTLICHASMRSFCVRPESGLQTMRNFGNSSLNRL